jgi:CRP-like cAMP-binding protein
MAISPHASSAFLASLQPADLNALLPHLELIDLPQGMVLFEGGDAIRAAYFIHSGIVSLVVDLSSGETIEAAMIGAAGLVGGASAVDSNVALNRAVVQVAGRASVLRVEPLRAAAERSVALRNRIVRHEEFVLAQAQQAAACNVSHSLEARLCRWLLRCRDLLQSDDVPLTQEFIAEMLGVRRTSVSMVAHTIQQAGFIRYHRGHIRVLNVEGLEESACECYATLKAQEDRLLGKAPE